MWCVCVLCGMWCVERSVWCVCSLWCVTCGAVCGVCGVCVWRVWSPQASDVTVLRCAEEWWRPLWWMTGAILSKLVSCRWKESPGLHRLLGSSSCGSSCPARETPVLAATGACPSNPPFLPFRHWDGGSCQYELRHCVACCVAHCVAQCPCHGPTCALDGNKANSLVLRNPVFASQLRESSVHSSCRSFLGTVAGGA